MLRGWLICFQQICRPITHCCKTEHSYIINEGKSGDGSLDTGLEIRTSHVVWRRHWLRASALTFCTAAPVFQGTNTTEEQWAALVYSLSWSRRQELVIQSFKQRVRESEIATTICLSEHWTFGCFMHSNACVISASNTDRFQTKPVRAVCFGDVSYFLSVGKVPDNQQTALSALIS